MRIIKELSKKEYLMKQRKSRNTSMILREDVRLRWKKKCEIKKRYRLYSKRKEKVKNDT